MVFNMGEKVVRVLEREIYDYWLCITLLDQQQSICLLEGEMAVSCYSIKRMLPFVGKLVTTKKL